MVKISALPPMISPDGDDEAPIVDDSTTSTKKFTLTLLKEWLQSLTAWITAPMMGTHTAMGVLDAASVLNTTGNKSVTGLGFQPRIIMFEVRMVSATASSAFGRGAMSAARQWWTAGTVNTGSSPNQVRSGNTDGCIAWLSSGSVTPSLLASRVSLDADGFTINVSTASGAFDVEWIAIA